MSARTIGPHSAFWLMVARDSAAAAIASVRRGDARPAKFHARESIRAHADAKAWAKGFGPSAQRYLRSVGL